MVSSWILLGLTACDREAPPAPPAAPPKVERRCPSGYSIDPPRSVLEPGIRAFREQDYGRAQEVFRALSREYEACATCRVWHADAVLFDKRLDPEVAAREAEPLYREAEHLHEQGCILPRRPRYYQLMGQAYLALRLAKREQGFDVDWLERAARALSLSREEFPTSAEVPYNQARVQCALAQVSAPAVGTNSPARSRAVAKEKCIQNFRDALGASLENERPRFLRTHRSTEDWIVRSRTQSEFGPLRADPRYDQIVMEAGQASPQRL